MWDLQLVCAPIQPRFLRDNESEIEKERVVMAEIEGVHVGFCLSAPGPSEADPLFVQVVAVAPEARKRGVGLSLLSAAAAKEPLRDIALATQPDNVAALAMNERFAVSLGANIRRVPLGTFRHGDLGIRRGDGYRSWHIQR